MLTHRPGFLTVLIAFLLVATSSPSQEKQIPNGTTEATKAIAKFKVPPGFQVNLWAAEPMLGNPVAFCIDEHGRILVAESYRFNRGTEEYRHRPFFLEGDLKNTSVDDRLAMYKHFANKFPGGMSYFSKYSDRIRLLEDRKGLGRADTLRIFADGFNDPLDGLAAGLLAKDGDVYFTCIPKLWKLRDTKGTGQADQKIAFHHGFGPMTAFLGHDLHGLIFGPDGKLYFSVGDRGYHVKNHEGKILSGPRNGAVFRCDPDGKNLEVVHTGLRNPQELAFDQFGNLYAADNNCDKGDHSRLVYIVEGGHSGWNMAYQTIEGPPHPQPLSPDGARGGYLTGPWHAEKLWHLQHPGQAAYIVPPIGKLGAGPSGFTFTSGLGWPKRYQNAFFMCNFTGNGGVDSFRVVPKGAAYELTDYHNFINPVSATDVDFGYDGKMYLSDWVQFVWDGGGVGKGRIYTVHDPKTANDPAIRDMARLMKAGFKKTDTKALLKLLAHPDMRVRLRAQYELAERGPNGWLLQTALAEGDRSKDIVPRIHALWALGQMGRKNPDAIPNLIAMRLLDDKDAEIRAQTLKVLGDIGSILHDWPGLALQAKTVGLIDDPHPRVRYFAMQTAGKLRWRADPKLKVSTKIIDSARSRIIAQLFQNKDRDPYLRHAAVRALVNIGDVDFVLDAAKKASDGQMHWSPKSAEGERAIRLAAVLVLRALNDQRIDRFLNDGDEFVVTEAARAINDLPIATALPDLARLSERYAPRAKQPDDALWRRILNANFRLGKADNASALIDVIKSKNVSDPMRQEAIACLADWANPSPRDRVNGYWRPLPKRDDAVVARLFEANLPAILASTSGKLQIDVTKLIDRLKIKADEAVFVKWVKDNGRPVDARIAALRLLVNRKSKDAVAATQAALASAEARLRAEARDILCDQQTPEALASITNAIDKGTTLEKQRAIRGLARLKDKQATFLLGQWVERLAARQIPAELELDVLEASRSRRPGIWANLSKELAATPSYEARMRIYRVTLRGGDPARGRQVFVSHPVAQCIRCHKVEGQGGDAGPDLSALLPKTKVERTHLLESLLFPSKKFTPGFGAVALTMLDGRTLIGTIRAEDTEKLELIQSDGKTQIVRIKDIEERAHGISPMPEMGPVLTMDEIRDVIEFLATLK